MKNVINVFEAIQQAQLRWEHGTNYGGFNAEIAKELGNERLGFHIETVDPGRFSCVYHSHTDKEELVIILDGEGTVRQNDEFFTVKRGDLVFYRTGSSHQMYNHSSVPLAFFIIANNSKQDVCTYPDSRKVMGPDRKIVQDGIEVKDYWKDEEDPRPFWPKDIVD